MLLLAKIHILLLFLWVAKAQAEENSATGDVRTYCWKLDKVLIKNLNEYLHKLEEKIDKLRKLAAELRQPLEAAKGVEEEYLSNPLHSFPLIRHMYQDWKTLEEFMRRPVGEEHIHFLKTKLPELPVKSVTDEATEAMYRMYATYNATPWDMAHGYIDGLQFSNTLTALDCFEIGKLVFKWGLMKQAAQWFNITSKFDLNSKVVEAMGLKRRDLALLLARSLVEWGQHSQEASKVLAGQLDLAENQTSLLAQFKAHSYEPLDGPPALEYNYTKLCRSSHNASPSRLHCRYNSTTSPFLILAPLKMEELSLDPYIVVYHDVLSVKKTEELIRFARPRMAPTTVVSKTKGNVRARGRTALGAWVNDDELEGSDSPFRNFFDVMRDITGLVVSNSDEIQLLKYGFGAHYAPHVDFFNEFYPRNSAEGDRIATVLFYLNDAPHGGDTVFIEKGIKVPAERGKVLFWYNLKGETHDLDFQTFHAACPVFQGFKFVMTVWIPELNQMFIQPTYRESNRTYFY